MPWDKVLQAWVGELMGVEGQIVTHDGTAFFQRRCDFVESLHKASAAGLESIAADLGMKKQKYDRKLELFPAVREETTQPSIEAFDKKHRLEFEAATMLQNPCDYVQAKLTQEHLTGPVAVAGSDDSSMQPSIIVGGVAKNNIGAEAMSLQKWWALVFSEAASDPANAPLMKKKIMSTATLEFLRLADKPLSSELNLQIKLDEQPADDSRKVSGSKGPRAKVFRVRPGVGGPLPFWGRVVDELAASHVPKGMVIPLGNSDGKGPSLYLDGSSNANAKRNDCALAWLILPQKAKQSHESHDEDAVQHAAKKAKLADIATHKVEFEPFTFSVDGVHFAYTRPVLVDLGLPIPEQPQLCIRTVDEWSLAGPAKKRQATATSFVAR